MERYEYFNDQVGIMTHHDAITGTSMNAVALDYNERMWNAIRFNKQTYMEAINEKIEAEFGITHKNQWQTCLEFNSTTTECSIENVQSFFGEIGASKGNVSFAVHNPTDIARKQIKIKVDEFKYGVEYFGLYGLEKANFEIICNSLIDCTLIIDITIPARGVAYLKL